MKLSKNILLILLYAFLCIGTSWIYAFGFLAAIVALVCFPIWLYEAKGYSPFRLEYFSFFFAGGAWFLVSGMGYGAQSLGNLVELFWLAGYVVVASYVSVFVGIKFSAKKVAGLSVIGSAIVIAVILRFLTPSFPE